MSKRLLRDFPLRSGAHSSPDDGMCAMETVAWLAGEEHSDAPQSACPVLTAYVRGFNDCLPDDAARDYYLRPLIPRLVRSRTSTAITHERAMSVLDQSVRVLAGLVAERKGNHDVAEKLRTSTRIESNVDARLTLAEFRDVLPRPVAWMLGMAADGAPFHLWVPTAATIMRSVGPEAFRVAKQFLAKATERRATSAA